MTEHDLELRVRSLEEKMTFTTNELKWLKWLVVTELALLTAILTKLMF